MEKIQINPNIRTKTNEKIIYAKKVIKNFGKKPFKKKPYYKKKFIKKIPIT